MSKLSTWLWVDAYRRAAETNGAAVMLERRGADEAGAVIVKLIRADGPFGAPTEARALTQARLGDGRPGWIWLAGPEWRPETDVDAKLARQTKFDPDLWVLAVEDPRGRHFLADPVEEV